MSSRAAAATLPPTPIDTRNLGRRLDELVQATQSLRLISDEDPAARKQQNRRLSQMEDAVSQLCEETYRKLRTSRRPEERSELSRLYVSAALLALDMTLFFIRWNAGTHYFDENGAQPSLKEDVLQALTHFEREIHRRGVRRSHLSYHLLATALRAWADKLSPEATTSSGWLEVASDVSRELRYRYQRYHTWELWLEAWARSPRTLVEVDGTLMERRRRIPVRKRIQVLVLAVARMVYGWVSGYGLRSGRFALTVFLLVTAFGGVYWILDLQGACNRGAQSVQGVLAAFFFSLSAFTGLNNVAGGGECTPTGFLAHIFTASESLIGYLMLGVLVSSLWTSFHETLTDGSAIRLKGDVDES